MRCIMRHIQKHRNISRMFPHKTHGGIGYGRGIVIIIRELSNPCQTGIYRFRNIITSTATKAAVVFLKSALHGITSVGFIKSAVYGHMPLTAHICSITIVAKHFGDSRDIGRYLSPIPGTMFIDSRHPPHTGFVLVMAGKQGRPAGTTTSRILKLAETYPFFCQKINIRSTHFTPITSQIGKSHVITQYQNNVRMVLFRSIAGNGTVPYGR